MQIQGTWQNAYIYINEQVIGNYTTRDWLVYIGLTLKEKGTSVYDNQNREIATQKLDTNTLAVIDTKKVYYISNFDYFNDSEDVIDFGTIEFFYNQPYVVKGVNVAASINLPLYNSKLYYISDYKNVLLEPLLAEVFSWHNETYYHSASPLIPK